MFDRNGKDGSEYNVKNIEFISKSSPAVGEMIRKEYERQKNNIELIACVCDVFCVFMCLKP